MPKLTVHTKCSTECQVHLGNSWSGQISRSGSPWMQVMMARSFGQNQKLASASFAKLQFWTEGKRSHCMHLKSSIWSSRWSLGRRWWEESPAASSAARRSGARGGKARERGRASGVGEEVEELTAWRKKGPRQVRTAGEGQIDDGGNRRPGKEEDGDPVLRACQLAFVAIVDVAERGGAVGYVRGARGRRSLR